MGVSAIQVAGVVKSFGEGEAKVTALKEVALEVFFGEMLYIVGPSGSGKTTLLSVLSGILRPDAGSVVLEGVDIWKLGSNDLAALRLNKIGFVFQEFSLFPNMTVRENLEYAGGDKKTVAELLGLVELENLAERYPDTLSGGQKQRVALARALARSPEILLLDEPFSTLDPAMKTKLQDEILRIQERYPVTTILVSHDLAEIYRLSSRVITVESGKITGDGDPQKILTSRETSHKFAFTGRIIDIRKNDIVYTALIAAGNTISEVVLSAADVRDLRPGDQVVASTKAFQPMIRKLRQ